MKDTGGSAKLKKLMTRIRKELPQELEALGEELLLRAAEKAPTPEEEYETMMDGGNSIPYGIPPMPSSLGDTDGDHRLRFYKPLNNYLQNVILELKPKIVKGDTLKLYVADKRLLNESSVYQWRNVDGEVYESQFPFWECWEGGMSGQFKVEATSGRLKPGLNRASWTRRMDKTIPAKFMFSSLPVRQLIEETIAPFLERMKKNR